MVLELTYPTGYYAYRAKKHTWDFSINVLPGDTNVDGIINVLDIIYTVNYILYSANHSVKLFDAHKVDLNTDGVMDILDITIMINSIID